MNFEYDIEKSCANKRKHGIDFDEAQDLWKDPQRLEIPARDTDEPRNLIIGIKETLVCCDSLQEPMYSSDFCKTI
ncbi:MAG: BrnT family toxin [Legionellales bacterium]